MTPEPLIAEAQHAESLHRLGRLALESGQAERAVELIGQAVTLKPRNATYREALGLALRSAGREVEAVASFRHAVRLDKASVSALYNLGCALAAQRGHAEAAQCFRRALAHAPGDVDLTAKLALLLHTLDREAEAGPLFRRVLELAPHAPLAHANYGIWLRTTGDLDGSEQRLRAGLAIAPADRFLHHALAETLLCQGRMREGFAENQWRHIPARFAAPAWTGEAQPGRTLLITIEQGHGDVLQFLRYVPLAAQRMRVVMETVPALRRLTAGVPGIAVLFSHGEPVPEHDVVCPLLSLPHVLGVDEAPLRMDAEQPYLRADPADIAGWAEPVAPLPGRKIGLVWAGGKALSLDRRRSVPPALFNTLASPDLSFVSLQKEAAAKPDLPLADWTGSLRDFADTAALIANLDLVISVDTAVAHLAGGLGKPVWLLNRFDADWRWLRAGDGSAWYPTLRQFRQPRLGDWGSVMAAVRAALGAPMRRPSPNLDT